MEMFILIYLLGGIATTVLYGMSYKGKDPPLEEVALCFFLWWLVLSIQIAFWCVEVGKYISNKCNKPRG